MVLHHILSIAIWPCTLYYKYCPRYVLALLSYEFSSVFLTVNWLLASSGNKQTLAYKASGLVFTGSFVVVRMLGAVPQLIALLRVPPWTARVAEIAAPGSGIQPWQVYACSSLVVPHALNLF